MKYLKTWSKMLNVNISLKESIHFKSIFKLIGVFWTNSNLNMKARLNLLTVPK